MDLSKLDFGELEKYVQDKQVTDINFNGHHLWIDHLVKGRFLVEDFQNISFINQLCSRIANMANLPFNASNCVVETETHDLRISILHHSVCSLGNSLSIRKTPAIQRLNDKLLIKQKMAPLAILKMLKNCVKKKYNIMISGLPGAGKTEFLKYLMENINPFERVITIEDTMEIRYGAIHPKRDCVMLKVSDQFTYEHAIKASLRQRPDWILLSEVRGKEVVSLMQCISAGTKLISTIHAPKASQIPERMLQIYPNNYSFNENLRKMIYETIDIGIHLESYHDSKGIHRFIKEIVSFSLNEKNNPIVSVLYDKQDASIIDIQKFLELSRSLEEKDDMD